LDKLPALHRLIFHIRWFELRRWPRPIGLTGLLLLVLFLASATLVRAGDSPADSQKKPPATDSDASPAPGLGSWIWEEKTLDNQTCQLWHTLEIPKDGQVIKAQLMMTVDNVFTLYLDGRELGRGTEWRELYAFDLTQLLTPGLHVLAVNCYNGNADAGMLFGLRVNLADGRIIEVKSDPSWRVVPEGGRRWEKRREAQPDWPAATIIAPLGGLAPMNHVPWLPAPGEVMMMPPLLPIKVFFWQTGWFQVSLLTVCGLVILISLRLMAQLALQHNEQRLLQKERARIAREIHDDIGARMTQLVLDGEEAQSELPDGTNMRVQLTHICDEARGLLATMDEILWAVNPQRDTLRDFTAYVCKYAQRFLKPTAIQCLLEVEPSISAAAFSLPLRRSLFMAIKEALNNAVKYSEATELRLKIEWQNQKLVVVLVDNGKGFDPAAVKPDRNGLTNMAQRMSEIGGHCLVTSQPARGCRVEFSIPLKPRHPWAWIWKANHFSEPMNDGRNDRAAELSQNHDPTKF
jgi:signal transduction histidine kinase